MPTIETVVEVDVSLDLFSTQDLEGELKKRLPQNPTSWRMAELLEEVHRWPLTTKQDLHRLVDNL